MCLQWAYSPLQYTCHLSRKAYWEQGVMSFPFPSEKLLRSNRRELVLIRPPWHCIQGVWAQNGQRAVLQTPSSFRYSVETRWWDVPLSFLWRSSKEIKCQVQYLHKWHVLHTAHTLYLYFNLFVIHLSYFCPAWLEQWKPTIIKWLFMRVKWTFKNFMSSQSHGFWPGNL